MIGVRRQILCGFAALMVSAAPAVAEDPPQSDLLNATLWMQRSVEFKATALAGFALAQVRLEQALADKNWTAAPGEQTGSYQDLPPAVILDIDETLLDNSGYQAWMVLNNTTFDPKTWNQFVKAEVATPIPGAVEFSKWVESKGVKVFYISNRTGEEEEATRRNMERYGFPMGGNVDTFLMSRERPDWTSAKSTRRASCRQGLSRPAQCRRQFRRLPRWLPRQRSGASQGVRGEPGALGPRMDHDRQPVLRLVRIGAVQPRLQAVARGAAHRQARRAAAVEGP